MSLASVLSKLRNSLSGLPILGPLVNCSIADHKAALREFSIAVLFGTATFWLSAFFLLYPKQDPPSTYWALLTTTVGNGELFIFAVGFLGSTFLVALDDPKDAKRFPGQIWHAVSLFVLGILCAGSFALVRLAGSGGSGIILDREFLLEASVWLASMAGLLRYLAVVYRKFTLRPDNLLKDGERSFAQQFAERHKGEVQ